ncbi:MAG: BCCT family transporter [Alphaproteobacteria bacterium]|jgi:BCCT family betaine/carnitine transporter|nr:BCCT family transporter [Alphaproteobacteria bacterium]
MSEPELQSEYETDYEVGQDNVELWGLDLHNPVFFLSAALVMIFAAGTLIFPGVTGDGLKASQNWALANFDWFFALVGLVVCLFCLVLAVSPMGRIRLGGMDSRPEFGLASWLAMLFAAGVGIGFMFYGVAEPLSFYSGGGSGDSTPLGIQAETGQARSAAFSATLFHWGLTPWCIYAVVGLALGFFAFNKGLPLTIRSAFYPLLGDRVWGWPGHVIDLTAVISTIFGLATTIGIASTQATAGLAYLLQGTALAFTPTVESQILLISVITGAAIISVFRGMDGGVKLLSNINMGVAAALCVFVIILGPTLLIMTGWATHLFDYARDFPALTNWTGRTDTGWFHGWTIFYWAWWISWSPFVGMFIARISKGRTVRQYLSVVVLAPVIIALVWFTAFGETAIAQFVSGTGELGGGLQATELGLFHLLDSLPLAAITSTAAIMLLVVFIVTSADSGALVIDSITSGGKTTSPVAQRVFWAAMLGLTASALLYNGGKDVLESIQAGTITAALPFTAILLVCCLSLFLGMRDELNVMKAVEMAEEDADPAAAE